MKDIIVIVGPTGVGKTKLSIELAKRLDAEIINGDSVAIYKRLDIGSAKPTLEERNEVVHHLVDIKDVNDPYSVYDYQKDVRKLIKNITDRGKRVIIVGGSGLYIKAALYNYQFTEGTVYNDYEDLTNEDIMEKLKLYYPDINIHINNRKRLIRLLNKYENGEVIGTEKNVCLYPIKVIGLTTDRSRLYERINARVDKMIEDGLVDEVKGLNDDYLSSRILNSAIGYKEFYEYLFNNKKLEDVITEIKLNSRRYAKRQITFFSHQFDTEWFYVDFDDFNETIELVYNEIKK